MQETRELQSANVEYPSISEELETSKEELQSISRSTREPQTVTGRAPIWQLFPKRAFVGRTPEKPLALATGTRANDDHYPPEGRGEGR